MGVWETYESRAATRGLTKRETSYNREVNYILRHGKENLAFQGDTMFVDTTKMVPGINRKLNSNERYSRDVTILSSDDFSIKYVISKPEEDIRHGDIVEWKDQHWLVTEKDYGGIVYTKCKMEQCNYLLRWIDKQGRMFETWSIVDDGTEYLTGEYSDRDFITTRPDMRIKLTVPVNKWTRALKRGVRFLIDNDDEHLVSYELTKPLKVGATYGDDGVYAFVLQEVETTNDDNMELRVADYYKYYDVDEGYTSDKADPPVVADEEPSTGRRSWL